MNKFSRYNHLLAQGQACVLYNLATDGIVALQPELAALLREKKDCIDGLQDIHPELYDLLIAKGMIVNEKTDEVEELLNKWQAIDDHPEQFTIMVLPTLDCNLQCWYCYEKHVKGSAMQPDTMHRIFRWIDRLVENPELKRLNLSFFGGEPLLTFRNVDLPLLQYARHATRQKGIALATQFTTNGVLLTNKVRAALRVLELDEPPFFQITIDGNRDKHNATRCTAGRGETFDTIMRNLRDALREGMLVTNRFNYNGDNVESFIDNLEEYGELTGDERQRLHFDFQPVWQDEHNDEARTTAMKVAEQYTENGLTVFIDKRYNNTRCPEDGLNQVDVNYDGRIYKCSAHDISPELSDGMLMEDGTIEWNDLYTKRMGLRYGTSACKACSIFPICHGGCSQLALHSNDNDSCLHGYSEKQKREVIIGRLTYLLKNQIQ